MKVGLALRELHRGELKLARTLSTLAARHTTEHEIHYVALDLAVWSQDHLRELTDAATRYDVRLDATPRITPRTAPVQERLSELLGRRPEPALILLMNLRHVHRVAAGVSVDWELIAQGAQAVKDHDLLTLTRHCHPQTLRQLRWANAMLKVLAPQVLAA